MRKVGWRGLIVIGGIAGAAIILAIFVFARGLAYAVSVATLLTTLSVVPIVIEWLRKLLGPPNRDPDELAEFVRYMVQVASDAQPSPPDMPDPKNGDLARYLRQEPFLPWKTARDLINEYTRYAGWPQEDFGRVRKNAHDKWTAADGALRKKLARAQNKKRGTRKLTFAAAFVAVTVVAAGAVYLGTRTITPWTTDGEILGRPAVAGGRVFVASSAGTVYAFNAATGYPMWETSIGNDQRDSSPVVVGTTLYIGSWSAGEVFALDTTNGHRIWETTNIDATIDSTPTVVGHYLYVGALDHHVYAVDTRTGAVKWQVAVDGEVEVQPAVAHGLVYVGTWNRNSKAGTVYALYANGSGIKWQKQTGPIEHSSPVVVGNTVYLGSTDGNLYILNAWSGKFFAASDMHDDPLDTTPAVAGRTVYIGGQQRLYTFDRVSGKPGWTHHTGQYVSDPVVVDRIVFFGSYDDNVYALDAVTGQSRWNSPHQTSGSVESTPTIVAGVVYIGSDDHQLYALNQATGRRRTAPPLDMPA